MEHSFPERNRRSHMFRKKMEKTKQKQYSGFWRLLRWDLFCLKGYEYPPRGFFTGSAGKRGWAHWVTPWKFNIAPEK